jgi:hypothetical protein
MLEISSRLMQAATDLVEKIDRENLRLPIAVPNIPYIYVGRVEDKDIAPFAQINSQSGLAYVVGPKRATI